MIEQDENDAALERLLHNLGSAKTDSQFEQRLLQGIAARQLARKAHRPRRTVWALAAAFVPAVLLIACLPLLLSHLHRSRPRISAQDFTDKPVARMAPQPEPHRRRTHAAAVRNVAPPSRALEVQEAAMSYPAPAAPLTDQERLLLKLAHRSDPVELTMLTPASFEADEARRKAEFQEFFKPPPPLPEPDAPSADLAAPLQASPTPAPTQNDGVPQ